MPTTTLSDHSESKITKQSDYVANTYHQSSSYNFVTISYQLYGEARNYAREGALAGMAAGGLTAGPLGIVMAAPVGAFVGWISGLIHQKIDPAKHAYLLFFDQNDGEFLGTTPNEAAHNATEKGTQNFINGNMRQARELFHSAYMNSTSLSAEESLAKNYRDLTDLVINGVDLISNDRSFSAGRDKLNEVYTRTSDGTMKTVIAAIKNEQAEKINAIAVAYSQQNNWAKARELFNQAFYMTTIDYQNANEIQNNRDVAEKMQSINSQNEISLLTELQSLAQNSTLRNIISTKLNAITAEEERIQLKIRNER